MEVKKTTGYLLFSRLKQWNVLLPMLFFDFLFFISLYSAATVFDTFFALYENALVGSWKGYVLFLVYFLALVFAYSFFKYCVLHFVETFWTGAKVSFTFSRLKDFFVYNLITFFVLFSIFLTLVLFFSAALVDVLKQPAVPLFSAIFFMSAYVFLQMSHILFLVKKDLFLKEIPPAVWKLVSWKFLGRFFFWNGLFASIFLLFYAGFFVLLREMMQQFLASERWFFVVYGLNILIFLLLLFFAYFFFLWNRLYLYKRVQQELEKNIAIKQQ